MKQRKQLSLKLMAWFLCLAMLFGMMPLSVFAAEREGVVYTGSAYYVNPLYADIVSEEDFAAVGHAPTYNALIEDEGQEFVTTIEEAADIMREGMMNREETICVKVCIDGELNYEEYMEIFEAAIAHDRSEPAAGDYLLYQFSGFGLSYSWYVKGGTNYVTYTFNVTYYTTAAQEAIVDAQVAMVLDSLNLDGKSDVEKVQAIYDWMTENIYYDNENLNNDSYLLQYTAYAALVNKTSVCQGYANLLYRFLLEEGIDCRIISGIGGGGPHAWNIIGLDGLYYNADATWDATYAQAGMKYAYFLRCEDNFSDHIRDEKFLTSQFMTQYPMANSDYAFGVHSHTWNEGVVLVEPTEYSEGVLEYICTGCSETKTESIPKLEHVHSYDADVIAPTCTAEGYTLYTCGCGDSYKDDYKDALDHDTELRNVKEASCEAEGYTGDEVCKTCGATIAAGEVIPAAEHSFSNGICTVCGAEDPDYVAPTPTPVVPTPTPVVPTPTPGIGGQLGTTGYWSYDEDTMILTVGGNGKVGGFQLSTDNMGNVKKTDAPWFGGGSYVNQGYGNFSGNIREIVVEEGVTDINQSTFAGLKYVHTVHLPSTLTEIDDNAFRGCSRLTTINLPNGLTELGSEVFGDCGLQEIVIPGSLREIPAHTFFNCTKLQFVTIEEGVTKIGRQAFAKNNVLGKLYLPVSLTEIVGSEAFWGANNILEVHYAGTKNAWKQISMDSYVRTQLEKPGIQFGTAEPTPPPGPATNPFVDVAEKDYFYAPVLWAVEEGITGGMDATHFAPNNSCTRGQVVTFLWRANGSPEPKSTSHPFTDISADKYYYKAVLWAVEEGITAGLTATTFAPNNACTRGQIATFLWRANGSPEPQSSYNPFSDVYAGSFYKAILWAVENGITTGYAGGTFRPGNVCTRGNIVTFLYRAVQ